MNKTNARMTGSIDCVFGHGKTEIILSPLYDNRFGAPGNFSIARCPTCDVLQTVPRPDAPTLNALYEHFYNFSGEETTYTAFREWLVDSALYKLWLAMDGDITFSGIKGTGWILDVGCNQGRGLAQFRKNGFDAEGQEPNPVAARAARARGFKVSGDDLENLNVEKPYQTIVLSNVLEHSLAPRDMLEKINQMLAPDGEVWISLPNADSALQNVFGGDWINWHVPFHITHFTGPHLRRLLAETGFDVFSFRNETPALWVAHSIIAKLYSRPGEPTRRLRRAWFVGAWMVLVRTFLFPTLWGLNRNWRGDCLVVRARKMAEPQ